MSLVLDAVTVTTDPGARALFPPVSAQVAPGEVAVLLGASGAGKSSLLDAIGGHLGRGLRPGGRILLDGQDVTALPAERRQIGVLFQDALLFPHLSVAGNLAFGLAERIRGAAARRQAVDAALDNAGLAGLGDRDPATLSGGQRVRAALMRALLAEPRALLLDEPFARLDSDLRAGFRDFVLTHVRSRAIPAIMATHDPEDARAAGGSLIRL